MHSFVYTRRPFYCSKWSCRTRGGRSHLEPIRILNTRSVAQQIQFESRSLKSCMEVLRWSSMSLQSFSRCPRLCGSGSIWCCRFYNRIYKGRRPRLPLRNVVGGILYVLWTGCQWKAMPSQFGSGSAIHAYFQEWVQRGVFEELCGSRLRSTTSYAVSTGNGRAWTRR
jgi:transposase